MGYDMSLHRPPAEIVAAGEAAQQRFREACDARDAISGNVPGHGDQMRAGTTFYFPERDTLPDGWEVRDLGRGDVIAGLPEWLDAQQAVSKAMDAMYAEGGEYRLNVWGMGVAREVMAKAGMIHNEGEDNAPPWGAGGDCSICDEPGEVEGHDWSECRLEREPRLSWAPEHPGICAWKLGSNDGWVVTAIECRSAVEAWEALDTIEQVELLTSVKPDGIIWWPEWIAYLTLAAAGHGFRVY